MPVVVMFRGTDSAVCPSSTRASLGVLREEVVSKQSIEGSQSGCSQPGVVVSVLFLGVDEAAAGRLGAGCVVSSLGRAPVPRSGCDGSARLRRWSVAGMGRCACEGDRWRQACRAMLAAGDRDRCGTALARGRRRSSQTGRVLGAGPGGSWAFSSSKISEQAIPVRSSVTVWM